MARYTRVLADVLNDFCDGKYNPMNFSDMQKIIDESWRDIFADFEIWDSSYREILCKKILSHFYMQEIGAETPMLFVFRLNRKMNEIMPYYNQLYRTIIWNIEDLAGIDFREEYREKSKGGSENAGKEKRAESRADDTTRNSESGMEENEHGTATHKLNAKQKMAQNEEGTQSHTGNVNESNTGTQKNTSTGTETQTYNSSIEKNLGHSDTETMNIKNQRSGADTQNDTSDGLQKFQDTPQGSISNLKDGKYLANATINNGTYESKMQYGSAETKTGTDTHQFSGKDVDSHKGNDKKDENSTNTREDDLRKSETRNLTDTNNVDISSLNESGEQGEEENTKGVTRGEKAKSTDEYISNMLGELGKVGAERHRDAKKFEKFTHGRNTGDWVGQIMKWRDSLINIDMMIIKDLESQFMGIW